MSNKRGAVTALNAQFSLIGYQNKRPGKCTVEWIMRYSEIQTLIAANVVQRMEGSSRLCIRKGLRVTVPVFILFFISFPEQRGNPLGH